MCKVFKEKASDKQTFVKQKVINSILQESQEPRGKHFECPVTSGDSGSAQVRAGIRTRRKRQKAKHVQTVAEPFDRNEREKSAD